MLKLIEPEPQVWERFVSGVVEAEARSHSILRRWSRAVALGAKAAGPAHSEGVTDAELRSRRESLTERCVDAVQLVSRLATETSASAFRAVLSDAEGVVVLARGGAGASLHSADTSRLVEGASWAERTRGTNAIGTAIAEGEPVAVVGRAHLEERNHGLVCYAAPIRDPFGELVAVLDVSGAVTQADPLLEALVLASAHAAEQSLRLRSYEEMLMGGRRSLEAQLSGFPSLLVEAPGVVRQVSADAAARLGQSPSSVMGRPVEKVLPLSWTALVEAALSGKQCRVSGMRLHPVPHFDARGRPLALAVFLERDVPRARVAEPLPSSFDRLVGSDPVLQETKQRAARVARSPLPVLLLAETGTGKELLARAIHDASGTASGPFLAINCGAMPAGLLEAELFGYAPGAFTGALAAGSKGKLGAADGGTLFLDEIGEMPEQLQALLLRVLDDGHYFRLGETRPRESRFRLISATCRDLPALVEAGKFRRDLYYRIRGAVLSLPPLRRRTDKVELSRALVENIAQAQRGEVPPLSPETERLIEAHTWPGNVRELKSALAHAFALAGEGEPLAPEHLPGDVAEPSGAAETNEGGGRKAAEARALKDAMAAASGNLSEAARRLGVARSTLYRMLSRHGLA
ncbi:sigma-54-dependent Fis family transcriptional regulator [Archangium lansingense]|uniref:Sigma-54-dependent Fis family transcriptional regulator n=1 Tax=Archangium lansingense TaxID=2995310 RepID=A0ABT4ANR3_9BACT|nr:sigma-54-dependent Fis family transcriptional regulator [Archangium lansinium]MCY1083337.1 sigma-54-dependent Fis family transcriptional regulator [Archangium lansinium]